MPGLDARALAVDRGPWIGAVELDVLDVAARVICTRPMPPFSSRSRISSSSHQT